MDFYASARKHGITEDDAVHAIEHALVAAEDDEAKCLYLGPTEPGTCSKLSRCCVRTAARW